MPKIVSTVQKERFEKYHTFFTSDWDVCYLPVPYTQEQLSEALHGAEYLFVGSVDTVCASVFRNNPQLKLVHTEGSGYDRVDTEAAAKMGIPVCNNHGVNNAAVAEHAIGLMLAALRRTSLRDRQIRTDGYSACQRKARAEGENELMEKKIGLIGMGAIGREVVKRLQGWECELCFYDAFPPPEDFIKKWNLHYMSKEDLVSDCDIISVHLPVLKSTINILDKPEFDRMKPTAIVINTARGSIVNQEALIDALITRKIAGCALDTIDPEPMPQDHPLLMLPEEISERVIMTPHIAGTTDEAFSRMLRDAIDNFVRVSSGEAPLRVVNLWPTGQGTGAETISSDNAPKCKHASTLN